MKKILRRIRRRYLPRMLLAVGTLLFTLLILEALVRVFLPQQIIMLRPDIYQSVADVGWRHAPNVDTTVNTGEGPVRLITDENGYRIGPDMPAPGTEDIRILALGDSFLEALQVEYEDTMMAQLADLLAQHTGQTVRIVNTGVGDWNPNHYRIEAENMLARESFDLALVFLYTANDLQSRSVAQYAPRQKTIRHDFGIPGSLSRQEIIDNLLYPLNDALETRSHLYVFAKNSTHTVLARLGLTAYYFPKALRRSYATSPDWNETADICAEIASIAAGYDVPIVFVLLPSVHQIDPDMLDWYVKAFDVDPASINLDQPSEILGAALAERNLTLIDTTAALRAAQANGQTLYGDVDQHFNENGHTVVAGVLFDQLEIDPP